MVGVNIEWALEDIDPGFYICHGFDIGTRLRSFKEGEWLERESLPVAPSALRYQKISIDGAFIFVNELGFVVALQHLRKVNSEEGARHVYDDATKFNALYVRLEQALKDRFCPGFLVKLVGETSFRVTLLDSQKFSVTWGTVCTYSMPVAIACLVEAVFIDVLCRTLERRSDLFLRKSSLVEDRLLVEYAECLFPLADPSGFLVHQQEIEQMDKYFTQWKLKERVGSLRQRFSESVSNTALYRGHLERNRQDALNVVLAAIAFLSLAQVSKAISEVLSKLQLNVSETRLNQFFVAAALVLLMFGFWQFVVKPALSLFLDNAKRSYLARQALDGAAVRPRRPLCRRWPWRP